MSFRLNKVRVFLGALGFASVPFAPWWVPLLIAIILCARYRAWEVVGIGIFLDLLWLPSPVFEHGALVPYATIVALFLILVFEPLRRRLLL